MLMFVMVLFTALFSGSAVFADEGQLSVNIDGEFQYYDQPPIIENGRTLVPLRGVFESLGASVDWDQENRIIRAKRDREVMLQIGRQEAYIDNQKVVLDVSPMILNGRTLVPIRFVSEAMGANVEWASDSRIVYITTSGSSYSEERTVFPDAPGGVRAVLSEESTVNIIWDIEEEIDHYFVYYSDHFAGPYEPFTENGIRVPFDYGVEDRGVAEGETWYYKVSAVKNGAESALSDAVSVTIPQRQTASASLTLVADDRDQTYLGQVSTNRYLADGIFNPYGPYGSEYSQFSIWNRYSQYGSPYASFSAFNDYSYSPPMMIDSNGHILAKVTSNAFVQNGIHPNELYERLKQMGY